MAEKNKIVILSLGGSVIASSGGVDVNFIKKFRGMILGFVKKGYKFVIVCGGGVVARDYMTAAKIIANVSESAQHWVGIYATWLNAKLMLEVFGKLAHCEIVVNPTKKIKWNEKILIGGGWKPGVSTDYDAVKLAENLGADTVINLSNVDYVYNHDPKLPGAVKIETMNWKDLQKIVGNKYTPGLNMPFDPIATKLGSRIGITLKFVKGADLASARAAITNKKFRGTVVMSK